MNLEKAREILGDYIEDSGALFNLSRYISWEKKDATVDLDGDFLPEELEAIAWWMRHTIKE